MAEPEVIDLIHVCYGGTWTTFTVAVAETGGSFRSFGPAESDATTGALVKLGRELAAAYPGTFDGESDATARLFMVDMMNSRAGHNQAGQDYPVELPEEERVGG